MRRLPIITAVAAVCLLASAIPATAQTLAWRVAPDVDLGATARPRAIAVGDFDSDGRQDLAIGDVAGQCVHIRLGNGDGTFRDGGKVTGQAVMLEDVAVADFSADGTEDLLVVAITSSSARVGYARGRGEGKFIVDAGYTMPGFAKSVAVGDFNTDGWSDMAVATGEHLAVRLGIAGGAEGRLDLPLGAPARSVAGGDFDGNGTEDVVVLVNSTPPKAVVLPGTGNGQFGDAKTVPLANAGAQVAVGDLDGDSRDDAVVAIPGKDRVLVRLGNGDGTLRDGAPDVTVGAQPEAVAVGDLDSDGHEDLVTANAGAGAVSVRLGDGDGRFRPGGELAVGARPLDVAIGDFDADGRQDLAVANHDAGTVGVRLGDGAAPLPDNLLVNGGFEQGLGARTPVESPNIPGWTTIGGMTFVRYGTTPHFGVPTWLDAPRYGGGRHFLWGGDSTGHSGVTEASQTVAVTDAAQVIDAGRAVANLSAYLGGGLGFPDTMTATAEFLDAGGTALAVLPVGPVTSAERRNVTTLLRRTGSAPVPVRTRRIRVTLTSRDTDRWSSAIADNVKLTLTSRPVPADPPPPPPSATPRPAFGADTRVTIRLAARRVRARGPLRALVLNANGFAVTGTLAARRGAGARRFAVAASGRTTVELRLRKPLRRRLARKGKLALALSAVVTDPAGTRRTVARRVSVLSGR